MFTPSVVFDIEGGEHHFIHVDFLTLLEVINTLRWLEAPRFLTRDTHFLFSYASGC